MSKNQKIRNKIHTFKELEELTDWDIAVIEDRAKMVDDRIANNVMSQSAKSVMTRKKSDTE